MDNLKTGDIIKVHSNGCFLAKKNKKLQMKNDPDAG